MEGEGTGDGGEMEGDGVEVEGVRVESSGYEGGYERIVGECLEV